MTGKTALANTLIGRPFEDTPSTIGINELTCDIKYANVGSDKWSEYKKPDREMEAAIAEMIANGHALQGADETEVTDNQPTAMPVRPDADGAGGTVSTSHTRAVGNSAVLTVAEGAGEEVFSKDGTSELGKYMQEGESGYSDGIADNPVTLSAEDAKRCDDELVMRCLAEKIGTDSKFILSVFDFGGQSVFNVRNTSICLHAI